MFKSEKMKSIRNLRDKHVAHYLTETVQEKKGPVTPMKHGDEARLSTHRPPSSKP
jgi:hypothetical protein